MVYFITLVDPSYMCYMGKHKEENEELIRWGWPEDVWFHVDKLSSAHVYLRLKKGQTTPEDIPREVLDDCVQLVKQNSIEGCKKPQVDVVYTMWANLRKTGDMQAGQVGFESEKDVIKVKAVKRDREAILRLKKNVREEWPTPDLQAMRLERDAKVAAMQKKLAARKRKEEAEAAARAAQEAEERSYDRLFVEGELVSNKDQVIDEDDFMM